MLHARTVSCGCRSSPSGTSIDRWYSLCFVTRYVGHTFLWGSEVKETNKIGT